MYNKVHVHKEQHIRGQPLQKVLQNILARPVVEVGHTQPHQDLDLVVVEVIQPHQDLVQVILVHLLAVVEVIRADLQAGVRLQVVVKKDENKLKVQCL